MKLTLLIWIFTIAPASIGHLTDNMSGMWMVAGVCMINLLKILLFLVRYKLGQSGILVYAMIAAGILSAVFILKRLAIAIVWCRCVKQSIHKMEGKYVYCIVSP